MKAKAAVRAAGTAACAAAALMLAERPARASAPSLEDLGALSLEELGQVEVTSVSKRPESLRTAPSSIYVISADDIRRSGAASLPEALRLAPNLQVAQAGASRYVITARGMNGSPPAQNFSNKLLVLVDGRSVYTPLYSGVYWDMQDVLLEDVDRIEVISGPGAVLWGANAVNGVINIITRKAGETQGLFASLGAGTRRRDAAVRYGGRIGETLAYRLYAKTFYEEDSRARRGGAVNDHWAKPQAGFRIDWSASPEDMVTLQGDAYDGYEAQPGVPADRLRGRNLNARWARDWGEGSRLQVQAFYDHTRRRSADGSGFAVDTYDVDLQQSFALGRHALVVGGGYRENRYRIDGTSTLMFEPAGRALRRGNLFVQDTFSVSDSLDLAVGAKLEDDAYVKPLVLPNARLSWNASERVDVWGAVSRAVRSPTPFDRDVVEISAGQRFLVGGETFKSETVTAYELGTRLQPTDRARLSLAAFYNVYDDLRSVELTPVTFTPLRWGNGMKARTYGLEAWGTYQLQPWWRLSSSLYLLHEAFRFKPGASGLVGVSQAADDPKVQASLTSSMDLAGGVSLDGTLRYVGAMPDPRSPDYVELNGRIGWALGDHLELSLAAYNLLQDEHREYPDGTDIPRSIFAEVRARY